MPAYSHLVFFAMIANFLVGDCKELLRAPCPDEAILCERVMVDRTFEPKQVTNLKADLQRLIYSQRNVESQEAQPKKSKSKNAGFAELCVPVTRVKTEIQIQKCMALLVKAILTEKSALARLAQQSGSAPNSSDKYTEWTSIKYLDFLTEVGVIPDFSQTIRAWQEAELKTPEFAERVDGQAWVTENGETVEEAVCATIENTCQLTIILGPSSSGKTYVSTRFKPIAKPFALLDGAIVRDWLGTASIPPEIDDEVCYRILNGEVPEVTHVSYIWQLGALVLPHCLGFAGFKDFVKIHKKTKYKKWMETRYENKNIVMPTTAVSGAGGNEKRIVKKFERMGYTVIFINVYATLDEVTASGKKRAGKEGKFFDTSGYWPAVGILRLMHSTFPKHKWIFVQNYPASHKPMQMWDSFDDYTSNKHMHEATEGLFLLN